MNRPEQAIEHMIVPIAKPRMTRRDKWLNPPRKCVGDYWAFKQEVKLLRIVLAESGDHIIFQIPMPKSWSEKKKNEMDGTPHSQTPDLDNLLKGLWDAVFDDDSHIWQVSAEKFWGRYGSIKQHRNGE